MPSRCLRPSLRVLSTLCQLLPMPTPGSHSLQSPAVARLPCSSLANLQQHSQGVRSPGSMFTLPTGLTSKDAGTGRTWREVEQPHKVGWWDQAILCLSHNLSILSFVSEWMYLTANSRTHVLTCFRTKKPPFLWTDYLNPSIVIHWVFVPGIPKAFTPSFY